MADRVVWWWPSWVVDLQAAAWCGGAGAGGPPGGPGMTGWLAGTRH